MTKAMRADKSPDSGKPKKRSTLGLLFNPQLGDSIQPLRQTNRMFIHLVASVFAVYGLIPKNYPGLRDDEAQLSFWHILSTAWRNVRFTKDGAPQAIMFLAIVGVMALGAFAAVSALFSLLVGHAHAQTASGSSGSMFQPETQDIADAWLQYLFQGTALPNYYNQMGQAIPQGAIVQGAFTKMLAFYSDAILIVAALILFYHLVAMVVETAHHGIPMGKRASQIWAPIRLVVAVGLLVPISGGLSAGQFIVVKVASLGSNLASQSWDLFLNSVTTPQPVAPQAPSIAQIGADMITMEACVADFNQRMESLKPAVDLSGAEIPTQPTGSPETINGHPGTKYSFSSNDLRGKDICGWYFIPTVPSDADAVTTAAYAAQKSAFNNALPQFQATGKEINTVIPYLSMIGGTQDQPVTLDILGQNAIVSYQTALADSMSELTTSATTAGTNATNAVTAIQPYGWIFAGTFLNSVERMQAMLGNASTAGMPETGAPNFNPGMLAGLFNDSNEEDVWKNVHEDVQAFNVYLSKSWAAQQATNAQCAGMIGLNPSAQQGLLQKFGAFAGNGVFSLLDLIASANGVWGSGTMNQTCGSAAPGMQTFRIGIDLSSPDPLSQIAALGHANLNTSFVFLTASMAANASGELLHNIPGIGPVLGIFTGVAGGLLKAGGGILSFIALIFFACGFALAYVLPLFPFTRFFFAVLGWIAAVLEAVIAIPLVALAHLNPEGEGLPGGSARSAYFFAFNIFLRPVLSIFGLIAGLMMFYIAISLLTYTFNQAIASSGGTAYGHEAISKVVYSIIYVVMMYICANHCFALITHVPEKALSWMGANAQAIPNMGEHTQLASYENAIATYAGQQAFSAAANAGKEVGGGVKQVLAGFEKAGEKTKLAEKEAEQLRRHNDMMGALGKIGSNKESPETQNINHIAGSGGSNGSYGGSPENSGPKPEEKK